MAKGTIYLHWKTREDLFTALLLRESMEAAVDILKRINNDPKGMFLSNLMKHGMYVIRGLPMAGTESWNSNVAQMGQLYSRGRNSEVVIYRKVE